MHPTMISGNGKNSYITAGAMVVEHDYHGLVEELGVRGRVSGEQLRAGCPIHGGRDPNFSLHVPSGRWTCHSSCGSGNFYSLVSRVLDVSFTAALDWVAERDLAVYAAPEPTAPLAAPERPRWLLAYEAATAETLPRWWFERGFDWVDAEAHQVRWDEAEQQLLIPVFWYWQLVGTIARNLKRLPKYQNSQGLVKSQLFYGQTPRPTDWTIVVEGPTDQMWLKKHGYRAVALLGLTMSERQEQLLVDCPEVVLALDNDEPGRAAQEEIVARLSRTRLASQVTKLAYPQRLVETPAGTRPIKDVSECSEDELAAMVSQRAVAV